MLLRRAGLTASAGLSCYWSVDKDKDKADAMLTLSSAL